MTKNRSVVSAKRRVAGAYMLLARDFMDRLCGILLGIIVVIIHCWQAEGGEALGLLGVIPSDIAAFRYGSDSEKDSKDV